MHNRLARTALRSGQCQVDANHMDATTLSALATLLTALGALAGTLVACFLAIRRGDKSQTVTTAGQDPDRCRGTSKTGRSLALGTHSLTITGESIPGPRRPGQRHDHPECERS